MSILASLGPRSFNDDSNVTIDNSWLKRANSKNFHHFFPQSYLEKKGEDYFFVNHIANITIVDDFLNKRLIRDKAPSKYMKKFLEDNDNLPSTMATHLIHDLDTFGVWANDYEVFFEQRLKAFHREFKKRLKQIQFDKIK